MVWMVGMLALFGTVGTIETVGRVQIKSRVLSNQCVYQNTTRITTVVIQIEASELNISGFVH